MQADSRGVDGKLNADLTAHCAQPPVLPTYHFSKIIYKKPINDTMFKLSVFWPSDIESRINKLRFSDSVSLSFKMRLTSVTCFCGDVTYIKFQAWNQRRKT